MIETKTRRHSITIYHRLLLLFFVVLIPFFVLSVTVNRIAEKRLLQQSEDRMENRVKTVSTNYDAIQRRLYSTMKVNLITGYKSMLANSHVGLSAYMLGRQVEELFTDLQQMKMISNDIEDIAVFMPRTERVISLNRYYTKGITDEELHRISYYMENRNTTERIQDAFRIHVMSQSTRDTTALPLYLIEVTLSDSLLLEHLNTDNSEHYAIISDEETIIASENDLVILDAARRELNKHSDDIRRFSTDGYMFCYHPFLGTPYYLMCYTPYSSLLAPVRSFRSFSIIALILAVLGSCVVCFYLSRQINRPFLQLMDLFQQVEKGHMEIDPSNLPDTQNEFSLVFQQFGQMMFQIRELMDQRVKQEAALQQAQYRELQAHIAPHFLYNSFNVLRHSILMHDQETAEQLTRLLAKFFKYLTYEDQHESVLLAEEYEHCADYLSIQKIRFGDSLTIHIDPLPEEYASLRVPPFILQPITENIFKHGIQNHFSNNEIYIKNQAQGNMLIIRVRDNGEGVSPELLESLKKSLNSHQPFSGHYGLYNINQRLLLFKGSGNYLTIDSEEKRFFEVQIHLCVEEHRDD